MMKHLKLFEDHSDYYTKANISEYESPSLGFTEHEVSRIENVVNSKNRNKLPIKIEKIKYDAYVDSFDFHDAISKLLDGEKVYQINVIYSPTLYMSIRKIRDEYYPVKYYNPRLEVYKCDQIDGLFKFIKDKI